MNAIIINLIALEHKKRPLKNKRNKSQSRHFLFLQLFSLLRPISSKTKGENNHTYKSVHCAAIDKISNIELISDYFVSIWIMSCSFIVIWCCCCTFYSFPDFFSLAQVCLFQFKFHFVVVVVVDLRWILLFIPELPTSCFSHFFICRIIT